MKRRILVIVVTICVLVGITGCGDGNEPSSETKKEIKPLKIENIDWNVKEGVLDGRRFVNFSYTNNSEYPVVDVEIEFKQKKDTTLKQLSIFDGLTYGGYSKKEKKNLYVLGYNRKLADPGETVSNSPCVVNGSLVALDNIKQYDLMEPDIASIVYMESEDRINMINYDFKTDTYSESTNGPMDAKQWSDSEISGLLPKIEARIVTVATDEDYMFSFETYGSTKEVYEKYV